MNTRLKSPALATCTLFSDIPSSKIADLVGLAEHKRFAAPQQLMAQGQPAKGMILIISGHISVSLMGSDGQQANLVRAVPGSVLGEVEAITGQPCLANCTTEKGTEILFWKASVLDAFLQDPQLARNLIMLSYQRLQTINQMRSLEQGSNVDIRIAHCLLRMSEHSPTISHSQSYIGKAVGCSRQTVNRVLGQLRDADILSLGKAVIEVHDRTRLAELTQRKD